MSADNAIFVQKRLDGFWWVWMGFMSEEQWSPQPARSCHFPSKKEALIYAEGWLRGEIIVEYGIVPLDPQTTITEEKHRGSYFRVVLAGGSIDYGIQFCLKIRGENMPYCSTFFDLDLDEEKATHLVEWLNTCCGI